MMLKFSRKILQISNIRVPWHFHVVQFHPPPMQAASHFQEQEDLELAR